MSYSHCSRRGLLQTRKNFEQSGFARTVLAYKRNSFLFANHESYIAEQRLCAKFNLQSFYRYQFSFSFVFKSIYKDTTIFASDKNKNNLCSTNCTNLHATNISRPQSHNRQPCPTPPPALFCVFFHKYLKFKKISTSQEDFISYCLSDSYYAQKYKAHILK